MFFKKLDRKIVLLVARVVEDTNVAGAENNAQTLIEKLIKRFELDTFASGPGRLRFFEINTVQHEDMKVSTDADDKLNFLNEYLLTRIRRKQSDDSKNDFETLVFASTNSSSRWIGSAASLFCLFYASYLQQKAPHTKVCHLVERKSV